jgi:hypothetical protein
VWTKGEIDDLSGIENQLNQPIEKSSDNLASDPATTSRFFDGRIFVRHRLYDAHPDVCHYPKIIIREG